MPAGRIERPSRPFQGHALTVELHRQTKKPLKQATYGKCCFERLAVVSKAFHGKIMLPAYLTLVNAHNLGDIWTIQRYQNNQNVDLKTKNSRRGSSLWE